MLTFLGPKPRKLKAEARILIFIGSLLLSFYKFIFGVSVVSHTLLNPTIAAAFEAFCVFLIPNFQPYYTTCAKIHHTSRY
jgi:hypothetical protein